MSARFHDTCAVQLRVLRHAATCLLAGAVVVTSADSAIAQQTWYVAPGGTGDGSSSASALPRIQLALQAAQPGDTVLVAPGTYAELVATVRGGAVGLPITIKPSGAPGSVVVSRAGQVLQVSHPDHVVDGLHFDGQYAATDAVRVSSNGDRFVLRHAEIRRSGRDCVDMVAPDDVLFEESVIHHCLWWDGTARQDAHGIVAGAVHGLTIRDVEIHTFSGDAVQLDPGRSLPGWDDVVIERSTFWLAPLPAAANGFAAGVVPGENAVDTKTNITAPRGSLVIRDTVARGFRGGLISNMAAFNLKEQVEATLDRVTVSGSQIAFRLRGPGSNGGAWVRLRNTVIHDVDTGIRYEDGIEQVEVSHVTFGSGVSRMFRAANSSSAGVDVRNTLVLAGALPAEAPASGRNLAVGATAFVAAPAHDYRLVSGTPAVDAGFLIADIPLDRAGTPRLQGAAPDIGAYERASSTTPTPAGGPVLTAALIPTNPTNGVRLTWTNVAGETGYEVERALDGTAFARVATSAADDTSWGNTSLTSGATYAYRVRAITGSTPGAWSHEVSITLEPERASPSAPTALTARLSTTQPTSTVRLSWQDTSLEEDGFYVERSSDGVSYSRVTTRSVNVTSYSNSGLTSGRTYWYRVRAFNGLGAGAASAVVSIQTQ